MLSLAAIITNFLLNMSKVNGDWFVLWCLTPLSTIFQLIVAVSFFGGGNRSTRFVYHNQEKAIMENRRQKVTVGDKRELASFPHCMFVYVRITIVSQVDFQKL
jgi:hypothetical protein